MHLTDSENLLPRLAAAAIFLLIGFPIHELAHGYMAYRQGDGTAKLFGRLTFDPRAHFDPQGGMLLLVSTLLAGIPFGWAKPTPVNPGMMRDGRRGNALVAAAGPLSNLCMAVVAAIIIRIIPLDPYADKVSLFIAIVLETFLIINIALFIFNLIPVPPLDGYAVLINLLNPRSAWTVGQFLRQYGMYILLGLLILAFLPAMGANVPNPLGWLITHVYDFLVGI